MQGHEGQGGQRDISGHDGAAQGRREDGRELRPRPVLVGVDRLLEWALEPAGRDQGNAGQRADRRRPQAVRAGGAPGRAIASTPTAARRKEQVEQAHAQATSNWSPGLMTWRRMVPTGSSATLSARQTKGTIPIQGSKRS